VIARRFITELLGNYQGNLYIVLDGAGIESIQRTIHSEDQDAESVLLYQDTDYKAYSNISPCIVKIKENSWIFQRYQNEKEVADFGIVYGTHFSLPEFKRKLSSIVEAKLPSGNISLFRFYDPFVIDKLIQAQEYKVIYDILCNSDFIAWFPDISCFNDNMRTINTFTRAEASNLFAKDMLNKMKTYPQLKAQDYSALCMMPATIDNSNLYTHFGMQKCIDSVNHEVPFRQIITDSCKMLAVISSL
jgi:hypothetical protein